MLASVNKLISNILNRSIRRSPLVMKMLFGVKVHRGSTQPYWDFTTLALKHSLAKNVRDGMRVLEIGTGACGALSIYLSRRCECDFVAADINESYVRSARETAEVNGADIEFIESDLFARIEGKFDVIFWNSVYIPRSTGEYLGLTGISSTETDWCGGDSGLEIIDRFLEDGIGYMTENAEIHLGFNPMYLKEEMVKDSCAKYGYTIKGVDRVWGNPSCVYVLRRAYQRRDREGARR